MRQQKLIIIGLDAADFQVTDRLMEGGAMPRLSAIAKTGCFSRLKSVVPSQTAPAWTSITTGVNPGKHGIYYFYNFSTTPLTIINATDTSTPRIWDYVETLHEKSVVVNVPITYPVHEMSGFMISGIPPWYIDERSVFPAALLERLRKARYEIDTPLSRGLEKQPEVLVNRLMDTERRRVETFLGLLEECDWSFGMIVMTGLDRLQHKAVGKGEKEDAAIRRAYHEVDELVGKIIDSLGDQVNYLVVSDHGFNRRPVAFYPNTWLREQGFLRTKSSVRNRLTGKAHDLFDGHLLWLPQAVTKRYQGAKTVVHIIDAVDTQSSRAFVPGTDGVMVVRSKEDQRVIASGLSALKDESGQEVCKVYSRDAVFRGGKVSAAPELLIVPRDDINIRTDPFSPSVLSRSGDFPKGNHSPNGIFLAAGPGIREAEVAEVNLEDVAPTSLALMGIRPPELMDGRTIVEILSERRPPEKLERVEVAPADRAYAFSEEDEKSVLENLERLGYS